MCYRRPEGFAANIRVRCRGDTGSPGVMPLWHKPGDVPTNSTERSHSFDPATRYDLPQNPAGGRPRPGPSCPAPRPPHVPGPHIPRHPRLTETPLPPPGTARGKATDGAGAGSVAPKAGPRGEAPAAPSILRSLLNFSLTAHSTGSKCCAPSRAAALKSVQARLGRGTRLTRSSAAQRRANRSLLL